MHKILLSGVPGSGKSTAAEYIEATFGFMHVDMEKDDFAPRYEFEQDRNGFLSKLKTREDVLISWGFGPFRDYESVKYILDNGFSMVWLDGNRVASFREFMKRESGNAVKEAGYYHQMYTIVTTGIVQALKPRIVNPFTENGEFRPIREIAAEIIG